MRHHAIILKKQPLREHDELIMCYTMHAGKQRYQAKSARRAESKQGHHLDVLNVVEFNLIEGKHHAIMASTISVHTFPAIKKSLPALAGAFFILECFDKLVFEGQEDRALWEFLSTEFAHYDKLADERATVWPDAFATSKARLFTHLGYGAESSPEALAEAPFRSLQFLQSVIH